MPEIEAPAAEQQPAEIIAQVKSMVELPETATDIELITVLVNIITNLQEKYEGLLADTVAMEDKVANREMDDFKDVITDATRGFWKEQILSNRSAALEVLAGMRALKAPPAPEVPAAEPPPPAPLRNRLAAIHRSVETVAAEQPIAGRADNTAARIRNRAHEISKTANIPFMAAFARAEKEFTAPKE